MLGQISFSKALADTAHIKRHLLLGNGFSIALFPKIFQYTSLLDRADFTSALEAKQLFDLLKTSDFEVVIKALNTFATVAPPYGGSTLVDKAKQHADHLKQALIEAIASHHPARPGDITEDQYRQCRAFLAHFIGEVRDKKLRGKIFTLNYDLLLYWVLCHVVPGSPPDLELDYNDGFGEPKEKEADYVQWDARNYMDGQRISYLHGALHLYEFDGGAELLKMCWERSSMPLMEQISEALEADCFPLFVAEGDAVNKLQRIRRSAYLHHAERKFAKMTDVRSGALFVFGHSLAESDKHMLDMIQHGKISSIYVSLYGASTSSQNQSILRRAEQIVAHRGTDYSLKAYWFSAAEAKVWG